MQRPEEANMRYLATLFATLSIGSLFLAPAATAAPDCTSTGPNTTICQTKGSSQIVTSPPANNYWGGWPFWTGGLVVNFGGW
jgi:hypothetical protein